MQPFRLRKAAAQPAKKQLRQGDGSAPCESLFSALFQHPRPMHRLTERAKQLRYNFYRFSSDCSFAYSALASFRMWRVGSASIQRARKFSYAARALAVSTDIA